MACSCACQCGKDYFINEFGTKTFCFKVTDDIPSDGIIVLDNTSVPIANGDKFKILLCGDVSTEDPSQEVMIMVNDVVMSMLQKNSGNSVTMNQIRKCGSYFLNIGTGRYTASLISCVPLSVVSYPDIEVPTCGVSFVEEKTEE